MPAREPRSLSENSKESRAWGLHGERKARGGGDVDAHRRRRATQRSSCNPHAPFGFRLGRGICFVGAPRGCAPTSPASRPALHLPLPSQERGPFQFSDRLLDHGLNFWLKLRPQEPWARQTELANPKQVFGEFQPARIIININSGLIRKIHGQIQLTSYNPTVFAMQN